MKDTTKFQNFLFVERNELPVSAAPVISRQHFMECDQICKSSECCKLTGAPAERFGNIDWLPQFDTYLPRDRSRDLVSKWGGPFPSHVWRASSFTRGCSREHSHHKNPTTDRSIWLISRFLRFVRLTQHRAQLSCSRDPLR